MFIWVLQKWSQENKIKMKPNKSIHDHGYLWEWDGMAGSERKLGRFQRISNILSVRKFTCILNGQ